MQDIVDLAARLGKAIAESPQAATLRAAKGELDRHADLTATLKDYSAQADKIAKLEAEGKPVEVGDKQPAGRGGGQARGPRGLQALHRRPDGLRGPHAQGQR